MTGGLPGIKAEAQKVAANIGEAARRYAETDAAIAAKIRRLVFPALDDEPGQGHIQGVGFRPAPRGPITWCLQPGRAEGKWRCSVLYPDGHIDIYWSWTDDTGGSLP